MKLVIKKGQFRKIPSSINYLIIYAHSVAFDFYYYIHVLQQQKKPYKSITKTFNQTNLPIKLIGRITMHYLAHLADLDYSSLRSEIYDDISHKQNKNN